MNIFRASLFAVSALSLLSVAPAAASELTGTAWRPVSIGRDKPVAQQKVTFEADGRIFGSDGCNSFSGTYTASGKNRMRVPVSDMIMTMRGCLDDNISKSSQAFMDAVTNARSWRFSGSRLYLLDGKGKKLVELRR